MKINKKDFSDRRKFLKHTIIGSLLALSGIATFINKKNKIIGV